MAREPKKRDAEEEKYFLAAKANNEEDAVLEFDDDARVSVSEDGGAYVQGWTWVSDEEAGVVRQ